MVEVNWSERSLKDIDQIADYISQDSYNYAITFVDKIFDKEKYIQKYPLLGRIVPEFNVKNIREIIEGNYRIVYLISSDTEVHVLAVHHGAKKLTKRNLK